MKKGMLITFEGGEACGKSTQIKLFAEYLKNNSYDFVVSREPGGTELGEQIRKILLTSKQSISSNVEFLLFSTARAEHVEKVINPALEQGKIVILDRFYHSSLAYQGYAGNLDLQDIKNITKFAVGGAVPDLTFLLDISYEEGMKRKSMDENLKNLDRIESKGKAFHNKVREGYLQIAKNEKEKIAVVDATKSVAEVSQEIIAQFNKHISNFNVKKLK